MLIKQISLFRKRQQNIESNNRVNNQKNELEIESYLDKFLRIVDTCSNMT